MKIVRAGVVAVVLSGAAVAQLPDDHAPLVAVSPLSSLQMDGAHRPGEPGLDRPSLSIDQAALGWAMTDFYPPASWKAREEGTTTVGACLDDHGKVVKTALVQSSGFPRLDQAALKMIAALPIKPAT